MTKGKKVYQGLRTVQQLHPHSRADPSFMTLTPGLGVGHPKSGIQPILELPWQQ